MGRIQYDPGYVWDRTNNGKAYYWDGQTTSTSRMGYSETTATIKGFIASDHVNDTTVTLHYHFERCPQKTPPDWVVTAAYDPFTVFDVIINQPTTGSDFDIAHKPDYNVTTATIQASIVPSGVSGNINWTLNLEYETSGGHGDGSDSRSPTTSSGEAHIETYTGMGGRIVGKAKATLGGSTTQDKCTTFTITGQPQGIPNSVIRSRLLSLYDGATTELLCGIAWAESSYRQFMNDWVLYGRSDRWPIESDDDPTPGYQGGGSYIGLMQVPAILSTAWDWLVNTQTGNNIYAEKLALADAYEAQQRGAHAGLRAFTAAERENYALTKYAGYQNPLYIFNDDEEHPDWMLNPNTGGMVYVNAVRANLHR